MRISSAGNALQKGALNIPGNFIYLTANINPR
jgi:hypothetical protein